MENGVIAVCLDAMGHLTSLRLVDSQRHVCHPVTGTGLLKPLSGHLLAARPSPLPVLLMLLFLCPTFFQRVNPRWLLCQPVCTL